MRFTAHSVQRSNMKITILTSIAVAALLTVTAHGQGAGGAGGAGAGGAAGTGGTTGSGTAGGMGGSGSVGGTGTGIGTSSNAQPAPGAPETINPGANPGLIAPVNPNTGTATPLPGTATSQGIVPNP